ncbi:DNA (cytosine-5)-methyltransferase CMT1-like [Lolium rigidum]|uniref:DNA (cytosine-5)-methyltransferase CMT1-like n=1 Tax=Lolium rigidum TaxID=89674 RepID=UPI001F5CEA30|nr:DNA (cytosine-5)-methyltransferase CMT1-like [Lolium rigidum]
MSPVTPSPATEPRRSTRLRSTPADADADPDSEPRCSTPADADADPDPDPELQRVSSRRKRQREADPDADPERGPSRSRRKAAGEAASATRGSAAKDGPKDAQQPAGVAEAGSAINDDICAEEPDAEDLQMGEEEEEAVQAGGEGSAETRGAGKKRVVARPSARRKAVPDHFVGEPVPDGEARERWPERYAAKGPDSQAKRSDAEEEIGALRHYTTVCVDEANFHLGDDVYVKAAPGEDNYIGRITELFEGIDHGSHFTCRWFFRVEDTVISPKLLEVNDHKHDRKRVFLSEEKNDNMIESIISKVNIIYVSPNMTPEAKAQLISKCDLYYDMSYSVAYSTFANMPPENGDAMGSEATSDLSCDDVDYSKKKPIADIAAPHDEQMETATLLDLYSGCGAMSTGLCLGAAWSGLKLNTKWAVDMNTNACNSLKQNHTFTQVRNEKAEDFLSLLRHWDALCKKYDVHNSNSLPRTSNNDEDDENENLPEGTFEVEKLVDICYGDPNSTGKAGLWFKVRWKTYDPSYDTWEPSDGLSDSPERIKEFVESGYRESILPLPVLPKFPLPTHDVINRGVVPNAFSQCLVAYNETEDKHLKEALVIRDAISDLPKVGNHQPNDVMDHRIRPKTEFQHYIRLNRKDMKDYSLGDATHKEGLLFDHQPLQLNNDDYERGANFRDLKGVRVPSYAMTFIKGKSLKPFGRLWWDETVATVVTRAEPHNQIVLHPTQHRVLTVRENARLQGFPDYYRLSGPIKQKYIQVGNAVAVPVARALGYSLGQAYQGEFDGDYPLFKLPGNFIPMDQATLARLSEGTSGGEVVEAE